MLYKNYILIFFIFNFFGFQNILAQTDLEKILDNNYCLNLIVNYLPATTLFPRAVLKKQYLLTEQNCRKIIKEFINKSDFFPHPNKINILIKKHFSGAHPENKIYFEKLLKSYSNYYDPYINKLLTSKKIAKISQFLNQNLKDLELTYFLLKQFKRNKLTLDISINQFKNQQIDLIILEDHNNAYTNMLIDKINSLFNDQNEDRNIKEWYLQQHSKQKKILKLATKSVQILKKYRLITTYLYIPSSLDKELEKTYCSILSLLLIITGEIIESFDQQQNIDPILLIIFPSISIIYYIREFYDFYSEMLRILRLNNKINKIYMKQEIILNIKKI